MGEETVRRRVIVHGSVQGVFFRDSCQQEATSAGLHGWVRNQDDGSVEAVFEGAAASVDRLVQWAGQGPEGATVDGMDVYDEAPAGESGFSVR